MKTKSTKPTQILAKLGTRKKDQEIRRERFLGANGHVAHVDGVSYRIIVQTLGPTILASAEALNGPKALVNIMDRKNKLSGALRQQIEDKLYA